jgi:hypothetical protein
VASDHKGITCVGTEDPSCGFSQADTYATHVFCGKCVKGDREQAIDDPNAPMVSIGFALYLCEGQFGERARTIFPIILCNDCVFSPELRDWIATTANPISSSSLNRDTVSWKPIRREQSTE